MTLKVRIDWSKSGFDPNDALQDITAFVMDVRTQRGFRSWKRIEDEPQMTITLRNADRRFSPEVGVSSFAVGYSVMGGFPGAVRLTPFDGTPYAGLLKANLPIQLLFDDVPLWTGYTYTFEPDTMRFGRQTARLTCRGLNWLYKSKRIAAPLYTDTTADVVIADAIAQTAVVITGSALWVLGVPGYSELGDTTYLRPSTAIGAFDTGESTIPLFGFNNSSRDEDKDTTAMGIIQDALEHERGRLFTAADGEITFLSRNAWTRNGTPDVVASNESAATAYKDVDYVGGAQDLKNVVTVQGYQSADSGSGEILYTLLTPITVNAGERRSLEVYIKDDAQNVIAGKDIEPVAGSDTGWANGVTGSINVAARGQKLFIDILASPDATTTLTSLTIRGVRITSDSYTVEARNDASIAVHQQQEQVITIKSMRDVNEAQSIATFELGRRLEVEDGRLDNLQYERGESELSASDAVITTDIGTLYAVSEYQTGHSRKYRVTGLEHRITAQTYTVTYWLEPAYTGDVWVLGTSTLGNNTVLGY